MIHLNRALPDSNWNTPNWQLGTLPVKLRALKIFNTYIYRYWFIYNKYNLNRVKTLCFNYFPNFVIYILTTCWNVNRGKMYLEKTKIKANKVKNEKVNWLTKKNGANCGIIFIKKFLLFLFLKSYLCLIGKSNKTNFYYLNKMRY